eukprot:505506_1
MAFINQKTWNLISILFGCGYLMFISFPIVDISRHAFLLGFYKAIPVWMCSLLAMVGNDSMVGVALIFGSVGDIMLCVRHDSTFEGKQNMHLFKLGAGCFLIQHIIIIFQFMSFWKSFKSYSLFIYFIVFNAVYFLVMPNLPNQLSNIVCIYSMVLTTTCFLAINGLSNKLLKHEKFNVYATIIFLISDFLVILKETNNDKTNDNIVSIIKNTDPIILEIIIMTTYYAAQILFANGAYNRFRHNKFLFKRNE